MSHPRLMKLYPRTPRPCHYRPRQRIRHATLGDGTVVRSYVAGTLGNQRDERLVVNFDLGGEKELLWGFCMGKVRALRKPHDPR